MTSNNPRRRSGRFNFLLMVLMLQIPLFAYPVLRLCGWFGLGVAATIAVFLPLFFSQIGARLVLKDPASSWAKRLRWSADIWLGTSPLVLVLVLLAEVPVALSWIAQQALS